MMPRNGGMDRPLRLSHRRLDAFEDFPTEAEARAFHDQPVRYIRTLPGRTKTTRHPSRQLQRG